MLKRLVNEAHFTLTITTTGPVLIRSGHATAHGPDMTPVRTFRNGEQQVFLPGSSLKGVFRSHLEKVSRTLRPEEGVVCNPFLQDLSAPDAFCGHKLQARKGNKETIDSDVAYHDSCPICRLFGSTAFIGRVSINDAYLTDWAGGTVVESRDGVGIDRLTGGSYGGALFEMEVVSAGVSFETEVYLRNFETWQLGMMLLLVHDLEDGLIRVGSGTSRGLGSVKGCVEEVVIHHLGLTNGKPVHEVWGLGKLQSAQERKDYDTRADDVLSISPPPDEEPRGIRTRATFRDQSLVHLRQEAISAYAERLKEWTVPETMTLQHLGYQE